MAKTPRKSEKKIAVSQTVVLPFKKQKVWVVVSRTLGGISKKGDAFLFSENEFVLHYGLKKPRIPGNGAGMKLLIKSGGSPQLFRSFEAAFDFAVKHFAKRYGSLLRKP